MEHIMRGLRALLDYLKKEENAEMLKEVEKAVSKTEESIR